MTGSYYSGQPYDAARRREEIMASMQDQLAGAMRALGAIPMTSGVTRAPVRFQNGHDFITNLNMEVDNAVLTEGPRFLDRHSTDAASTYRERRYQMLAKFEGVREYAYDDATGSRVTGPAKGNITVGLGFNMDRENARQTWDSVFGGAVPFDEVRAGRRALSQTEIKQLFDYDIMQFENVVAKAAGSRALTENQRLALVSIAYTAPGRVSKWASLIQSGDDEALKREILYNSTSAGNRGRLSSRRYAEAALFTSPIESDSSLPPVRTFEQGDPFGVSKSLASRLPPGKDLSHVNNLNPQFASRLSALIAGAPPEIASGLGIYSGYRSPEHQARLFAAAVKKYGSVSAARKWVAPPGKSRHNHGIAADLSWNGRSLSHAPASVRRWVHQNASRYGLWFPMGHEPWHIEPIGSR